MGRFSFVREMALRFIIEETNIRDTMNAVEQNLANWKDSLLSSIPVGGLLSRNPVAYKWKATFRVWMLREAV